MVLAGAGCAFGLLPLFLADVVLNFEAIRCVHFLMQDSPP